MENEACRDKSPKSGIRVSQTPAQNNANPTQSDACPARLKESAAGESNMWGCSVLSRRLLQACPHSKTCEQLCLCYRRSRFRVHWLRTYGSNPALRHQEDS